MTFRELFVELVLMDEAQWERPESVFQHIPELVKKLIEMK